MQATRRHEHSNALLFTADRSRLVPNMSDSADAGGIGTVDGTSGCEVCNGANWILFGSGSSVVFTILCFGAVGGESCDAVPVEDCVGCHRHLHWTRLQVD
jgi:hypothetical protein